MSAYPITHVRIDERPMPREKRLIGIIRDISPRRKEVEDETIERIQLNEEDIETDEAEVKVVKPARGRRVKASEVAEKK